MSQRINASRVVVSVNMKSPITENQWPAIPQSQSRSPNRMSMRPVTGPDSSQILPIAEPIAPPSDRRMSRRKPGNQGIPLELFRNQTVPSPPVQAAPETLEAVPNQTNHATIYHDQSKATADYYSTALTSSPVITTVPSQPEAEEYDEAYSCDRPVFLLSQKYFGTRY